MTNLKVLNLKDNSFSFLSGQGKYMLTKNKCSFVVTKGKRTKRDIEMQV